MSNKFVRNSKFRHVFGQAVKKDQWYEGMKVTKSSIDNAFCAVNPKFLAVILDSAGGGSFLVIPLEKTGRVEQSLPKVSGHKQQVLDIAWNPFNDNVIASCSDDTTIKVWLIPDSGPAENITKPLVTLEEHERRVNFIHWHPTANNILLSVGMDNLIVIWNLEVGEALLKMDCHPDTIFSAEWNYNGSLIATTCKDKNVRIINAHTGEVTKEGHAHDGAKPQRVVFCGNLGYLFTTGFSRMSRRQWAVWDQNDLTKPLTMQEIDSSNGVNHIFYDDDTKMIYLVGKGDSVIRYYELVPEAPYCHYLSQYGSSEPQKGGAFMPKRGCNVCHNEVTKFFKLHSDKAQCEPVSFTVPRKSDNFQSDLFPETCSDEAALTADEWISGKDAEPKLMSLAGSFQAKEKSTTSIGSKNVMAGLSSKKLAETPCAGDSDDVKHVKDEVESLKKRVENNEKEIAALKELIKELQG